MENLRPLGPAAPEQGWVPAPRYLLRRDRVKRALRAIAPCPALEIGCGAGLLLHELAERGFECNGLETSPAARELATHLAGQAARPIRLHAEPAPGWRQRFGLLMALEVLEHIEDDLGALQQWRTWAAPGARFLLSVPAHPARWNARDVWAGHVRRYERAQLAGLFHSAGFAIERIECYGFPLANVLERAAARRYAGHQRVRAPDDADHRDANTAQSGIDRSSEVKWYPLLRSLPGRALLAAAIQAQRPFLGAEAGNGYLVVARAP